MEEENKGMLDLTEKDDTIPQKALHLQTKPYDPRPGEDSARRNIAYILLCILGLILIWAVGSVSLQPDNHEKVIAVLQIVLGPLVALVSAATGFYFGANKNT